VPPATSEALALSYGAAGSVQDLNQALTGQGVGTFVTVKLKADKDGGTPNSFGFGVKFPPSELGGP